ncbi:MAG: MAPEG family protein [Acetobacteraceae bacterium]|nr:MAPEG family protein [Acetobacteraceae bacterium]
MSQPSSPSPSPNLDRSLSLLLASTGIAVGMLGWKGLVEIIPADPAWSSTAVRLGIAALALLPGAIVLWLMIATQMAARIVSGRFYPTEGRDTAFLHTNQRALTNTVEQSLCFVPALLALAAGVTGSFMPQVIALALVFAAARLVFWLGYLVRPVLRAPGMAASFATVTATLIGAVWAWLV